MALQLTKNISNKLIREKTIFVAAWSQINNECELMMTPHESLRLDCTLRSLYFSSFRKKIEAFDFGITFCIDKNEL